MGRCVHEADEKWGGESKGADEKWGGESVTPTIDHDEGEEPGQNCRAKFGAFPVRHAGKVSDNHLVFSGNSSSGREDAENGRYSGHSCRSDRTISKR